MSQKFLQGRTNNHLTWAMVDATDFATPESALSAATKIKIYGKLQAQTGVYFVSSGTGSLTNDIQHVGASALGLYTIALAKADLSDASAAWYDQYVVSLSATGAAYQALVVEGILAGANVSGISALLSDMDSALTSRFSNLESRVPKLVASNSQLSDLQSDLKSYLGVMSDIVSNINSMLVAGTFALGASNLSDIGSRVWADTIGTRVDSRLLKVLSDTSDLASRVTKAGATASMLSDFYSDFQSRVPKAVATNSQIAAGVAISASDISDLRSAIAGVTATLGASDISDIASAVWANTIGTRVDSRVLKVLSDTSDLTSRVTKAVATASVLSDFYSDFQSRVPKLVANNSQLSDLASDIKSAVQAITITIGASDVSDIASAVLAGGGLNASQVWAYATRKLTSNIGINASDMSDIRSAITGITATLSASDVSDIASAVWANAIGSDVNSKIGKISSRITKAVATTSMLSDLYSDFQSRVPKAVATNSQLSDLTSDLKSYLGVMSDITSNINSMLIAGTFALGSSNLSDIGSRVWADAIGTRVDSRLLKTLSDTSNIYSLLSSRVTKGVATASMLSDFYSDFQSKVPKAVATNSQLSDLTSDLRSYMVGVSSQDSNIYSLLSNVHADLAGLSDIVSNVHADIAAGVNVNSASARLIADSLLNRDIAGGGSGNTRNVRNALRPLRNKTAIDGTNSTIKIYQENDATVAWSGAISTAAGDPLTTVDPT